MTWYSSAVLALQGRVAVDTLPTRTQIYRHVQRCQETGSRCWTQRLNRSLTNHLGMATLARIAVHPIKALDPVARERVSITGVGGLASDRTYALVDADGEYVNGKRTAAVHPLQADIDLETKRVELSIRGANTSQEFHLDRDRAALEAWLSEYFGFQVGLETAPGGAQTDSAVIAGEAKGPSVISRATLREVSSWYDDIDPAEMRLRLRPNLVVDEVPAFWEDKLVANGGRRVRIGDVTLEGTHLIPRCVVPTRDPHTGEAYDGFQKTFMENRKETLPAWADPDVLGGNYYQLMAGTRIPDADRDGELKVGDEVRLTQATVDG